MAALFELDGDDVIATHLTQGPWHPNAQYGGAPAALLTWGVEQVPTLVPMRIVRLTCDMHRPVPLGRLRVTTEIAREGKRLQVVVARIVADGTEVARATALRLRLGDGPDQPTDPARPPLVAPPLPDTERTEQYERRGTSGFLGGLEIRTGEGGVGQGWFRLTVPVIAGEEPSPVARVAMVADFAANSSNYLDHTRWSAINPDLAITLAREPVGEWTSVVSRAWYGPDGIGHSRADLFDLDGFIGSVVCTTLVDEVSAPYAD